MIMKKTGRSREQAIAELAKHNPQGRLVTPAKSPMRCSGCAARAPAPITGQTIAVAGGEV